MSETLTEIRTLRVFTDGTDTIAAYDLDDVKRWQVEDLGSIGPEDFFPDRWKELAQDAPLTVCWDEDDWDAMEAKPAGVTEDRPGDGYVAVVGASPDYVRATATVGAWADWGGRGMICSTEY